MRKVLRWAFVPFLVLAGMPAGARAEEMILGVCCHPGYVRLMPLDWDGVFRWIKGCGARLCRVDWGVDWAVQDALLAAADKAGVEVLPVLFPPSPAEDTEQAWYETSRRYGKECARRYRGHLQFFELSNERECHCMTKWPGGGDRDGATMGDYDQAKYAPIRGMLRGLAEGVREGNHEALRLIGTAGWLHFGFIDLLVRDGVPFDVLVWHWYSEMGDMTGSIKSYSGTYTVLDKLTGYGKPVWVTEGNLRNGCLGGNEQVQAEYLARTIKSLAATGKIGAYVVYELFDEPYLLSAGGEAFYGLVHCEWGLSEGREFPGARGTIGVREVEGRRALVLEWDFADGGRYVSANWLPRTPVAADELRLTLCSAVGHLPLLLRFVDATGEHLQAQVEVDLTGGWQELSFPIRRPWGNTWAGNKDGVIDQPLRGVWIGVRKNGVTQGEVALSRASLWREGVRAYDWDAALNEVFVPRQAWGRLKELTKSP